MAGSSATLPWFLEKKKRTSISGSDTGEMQYTDTLPRLLVNDATPALGARLRTSAREAKGTTSCSMPVLTQSGAAATSPGWMPSAAASSAMRAASSGRVVGAFAVRVQVLPRADTGITPACV